MVRRRRDFAMEAFTVVTQALMPNLVRRHQFLMIRWVTWKLPAAGCGWRVPGNVVQALSPPYRCGRAMCSWGIDQKDVGH